MKRAYSSPHLSFSLPLPQFDQLARGFADVGTQIEASGAGTDQSPRDDSRRRRQHVVFSAGDERGLEERHGSFEGGLL